MHKLIRTALAGIVVALGLLLATASPAAAGFDVTDKIEPNFNVWSFAPIGAGSTAGYTDVNPRSGVQAIRLSGQAPGYAVTSRNFHIGDEPVCAAQIWVDPLNTGNPTPVSLEIVDPATYGFIARKTLTFAPNAGYSDINLAFVTNKHDVYVRVAVGTSVAGAKVSAIIDDLRVTCH